MTIAQKPPLADTRRTTLRGHGHFYQFVGYLCTHHRWETAHSDTLAGQTYAPLPDGSGTENRTVGDGRVLARPLLLLQSTLTQYRKQ